MMPAQVIQRSIRWSDWALSKIPLLISAFTFECVTHHLTDQQHFQTFLTFTFAFAVFSAAFGFLVNDWSDMKIDFKQGKRNVYNDFGAVRAFAILSITTALMCVSALNFVKQPHFIALWILSLCSTLSYSLPPLRLKERGLVGLIVSTCAQTGLPILLLFSVLGESFLFSADCVIFFVVSIVCGGTLELAHQIDDSKRDRSTDTLTFVVRETSQTVHKFYCCCLWIDRLAIGLLVFWIAAVLLTKTFLPILEKQVLLTLPIIYIVVLIQTFVRSVNGELRDPYYGTREMSDRFIQDIIPNAILPVVLLLMQSLDAPIWLIAFGLFVIWRFLLPKL